VRFAVIGDYGSGFVSQDLVAERMCRWREDHDFKLVVTTGDNIYPDGSRRYFSDKFFEPYFCLLNDGVRFRASLGNHDRQTRLGRDVIDEPAFGMPSRNYIVRNKGVRFVFADSSALDREWLSQALVARPDDRWTIVVFHHPVYTAGTYKADAARLRPELPRLFEERGVDLVLNGHDHLYFASKSLRRIRYVVTGGGGATLYRCTEVWYSAECQARNHFLYVVAGPDRITVRAIPTTGPPFHRFATRGR
jgi:3',5'-cyclic AMP phosphodiesterase CpdA